MYIFTIFFGWHNKQTPSKESIETLSALEIAEQMTYLDHQIFLAIRSEYVLFFLAKICTAPLRLCCAHANKMFFYNIFFFK